MNRSENMRRIKSRDTAPEMLLRRLVHGMGYRYRLHRRDVPGTPDLAFAGRRKAIFLHGCFWHAHGCKKAHTPKSNTAYWSSKLQRNKSRDAAQALALAAIKWKRLVIWECELDKPNKVRGQVKRFLR